MSSYKEVKEAILTSNEIVIASHISPDGDNLGSTLGLYLALKKIGKSVKILKVDTIPDNYKFLPGIEDIVELDKNSIVETFISLDCADRERLHINKDIAENANKLINIDHHISNDFYGDLNIIESESSSTGELVFNLIKEMKIDIDKDIATCLYTAISSDTGSFMYSNTTSRTHNIVSELYLYELDANLVNIELYQSIKLNKSRLFNLAMSNLDLYFNNTVALVTITKDMLEKTGTTMEDTEGLVETVRNIECVELAILIKEKEDCVKLSTRSKRRVDVSNLCSNFNGGGHVRAAGGTIYSDIEDAKKQILEKVELVI